MFPAEEWSFLRTMLDMPEDRNIVLVYADWLDDRCDPRAEFLRLMVRRSELPETDTARAEIESRLAHLRAELDPQWMMMFDPAPVGNCSQGGWVRSLCGQLWNAMAPSDLPDIRICRRCRNAVIYCHTLEEAQQYASCGQQVALSTRIPAEEISREPAFQEPVNPTNDSDEFELLLDAESTFGPAQPPMPERRPWWKFW